MTRFFQLRLTLLLYSSACFVKVSESSIFDERPAQSAEERLRGVANVFQTIGQETSDTFRFNPQIEDRSVSGYLNNSAHQIRGIAEDFKRFQSGITELLSNATDTLNSIKEDNHPVRDCSDIYKAGKRSSGVYRIWPRGWKYIGSFYVYCDMDSDGGGWTVLQRRGDFGNPIDYFSKNWNAYRDGFGDLNKEFWLGNDRIASLTNQKEYQLLINMWDKHNNTVFSKYDVFLVASRVQMYKLEIGAQSGTAGDAFENQNGICFSTPDKDNDRSSENCAECYHSGWWFNDCHNVNLNGLNLKGRHASEGKGIMWRHWKGNKYSLSATEMKIRPLAY